MGENKRNKGLAGKKREKKWKDEKIVKRNGK